MMVAAKDLTLELWQVEFFTGLSQPTLCRMMAKGQLETVTVNGRRLVAGSELARVLRKQFGPNPSLSVVANAVDPTPFSAERSTLGEVHLSTCPMLPDVPGFPFASTDCQASVRAACETLAELSGSPSPSQLPTSEVLGLAL
jgi:hypothetical protein